MLKLDNIQGGYTKGSQILHGIDLQIGPGEVVGIIGLNGSGKSTLGKAIMNMIPFRSGQLNFNGKDISRLPVHQIHRTGISMVLQGGRVFPNMTVWEHLQFSNSKRSKLDLNKRVAELEEEFGLGIYTAGIAANLKASYLSGGEKQKLVLMMALLNKPDLLILDEISAGLSPTNVLLVTTVLKKMIANRTMGIMLIEQNIRLATELADRLLLLERGIIDQQFDIDSTFDFNKLNKNIFN